jgi:tRNA uridine 5-carboxymethylaminomethyl modification enzyme
MFAPQPADERPVPFSFSTQTIEQPQVTCFIGYTNEDVHSSIRTNIHESPLYSGQIKGVGPRYCPSIEDKVVKFPDKTRHQLFLEPEGHNTAEVYLNGFSTSMPADFQQELVHKIPGLEEARIIRPGYAIEYDFVDPRELTPYLQTARIGGLFLAGQINGTTGYEEAACQGLLAGINAALYIQKREGFRLRRDESYIGVLMDDLNTHGVDEPYRMFTSRAEYRLALRYDTADSRLTPYGKSLGLVGDTEWEAFNARRERLATLRHTLEATRYKRSDSKYQDIAQIVGDLGDSITLAQLSQRPNVSHELIRSLLPYSLRHNVPATDLETALADLLYSGYVQSQRESFERIFHHDSLRIPSDFDFHSISGLSHEMVERLDRTHPLTFGQARHIPGMTPAALSVLLVRLKLQQAA